MPPSGMAGLRLLLAAVGLASASLVPSAPGASAASWTPPPTGVDWDYQIGGVRSAPADVGIIDRDRNAAPMAGRYNICYVNAFQTQADERDFWRASPRRWRLVLKDHGHAVVDSVWGEWVLDIRTAHKRHRLRDIVGRWTDGCAADGFDAVELDNLDSFSRSHGLVSRADARAYAALLTARAHAAGLAVAQKNWVELGEAGPKLGFDFAIAEECGRWRECAGYVATYGERVLDVEYRDQDFSWACAHFPDLSIVRRNVNVTPGGPAQWC